MKAIDVIEKLIDKSIINANLKFCLVTEDKKPIRIDGQAARPNKVEDFVSFEELCQSNNIVDYAGIGISIQASNVCAIDVDKCFARPNDITSADERAKYFLDLFKDIAYCEFSFSGTGLRIIFRQIPIENYSDKYYIKNETFKIEYYQPGKSFRYVTITGNSIYDNTIDTKEDISETINMFLNKYMVRQITYHTVNTTSEETRTYDELLKLVKKHYRTNPIFQNLWFTSAPGSGKDESERDYHLVAYLYENITQDKELLKQLFEASDFFKTKDWHHINKWTNQNFRYFEYLYNTIRRTH